MNKIATISLTGIGILTLIVAGIVGLAYALVSTDLWLKLPQPLKSDVAMARLAVMGSGVECREDCMFEKNFYREIIAEQLAKEGKGGHVEGVIEGSLANPGQSASYKEWLVMTVRKAEEMKKEKDQNYKIAAPEFLIAYLNSAKPDPDVRSRILSEFPDDAAMSEELISNLLAKIKDINAPKKDRMQAMWDLRNLIDDNDGNEDNPQPKNQKIDYPAVCGILLGIAEKENSSDIDTAKLRAEAIDDMYACLQFKEVFTADIFQRLKNIFYEKDIHPGVQYEVLGAVSYYEKNNKDDVIKFWQEVNRDKNILLYIRKEAMVLLFDDKANYEEIKIDDTEKTKQEKIVDPVVFWRLD